MTEPSSTAITASPQPRQRKYHEGNLIPMFRLAAALCLKMRSAGFTDNGGAIHSAERILNLLGLRLNYPDLTHINNLRNHGKAEFSVAAMAAHKAGEKVTIEHVSPLRALTRLTIEQVERGATNPALEAFVRDHFRLVLLTPAEALHLNKQNRSKIAANRLASAGMNLFSQQGPPALG